MKKFLSLALMAAFSFAVFAADKPADCPKAACEKAADCKKAAECPKKASCGKTAKCTKADAKTCPVKKSCDKPEAAK